jgi:hypothetical protein
MKNYFKTRQLDPVSDVTSFWESNYARGGLSGEGSYGHLYEYKRDYLLDFVRQHNIKKIVDLGCGDGNQTREIEVESYVGLDVSRSAIKTCQSLYSTPSKEFMLVDQYPGAQADLVISLDVIYHLVIDKLYFQYLEQLNSLSSRFILVYSSNFVSKKWGGHVRHRNFVRDLLELHKNVSLKTSARNPNRERSFLRSNIKKRTSANFFLFEKHEF